MEKISAIFQKKGNIENARGADNRLGKMGNCLLKGTFIAICISLVSLFIYAIVLANTDVAESTIPSVILIITAISLLAGAMIATRKVESKGIITGIGIGFIYMASMYLLSSIVLTQLEFGAQTIVMLVLGMVFAAIGGIIGVNLHK